MAEKEPEEKEKNEKEAEEKEKKKSFWRSKAMKRVYWVFGIPTFFLLLWYAYTVATVLDETGMEELEAALKQKAISLAQRAIREGFKVDEIDNCEDTVAEYGGKTKITLPELLGLPAYTSEEDVLERCVIFAKAVSLMEQLAHHKKHVFVCEGAWLDVANKGAFHIMPDPQGRGAFQAVDANRSNFVKIRAGNSKIIKWWQVYNVGDGCIIIGYSKYGSPELRPKVVPTGQ